MKQPAESTFEIVKRWDWALIGDRCRCGEAVDAVGFDLDTQDARFEPWLQTLTEIASGEGLAVDLQGQRVFIKAQARDRL